MTSTVPLRDPHDADALRAFWTFYEPLAAEINAELMQACLAMPAWAEIVRAMPPDVSARQNEQSLALQRDAIVNGRWEPWKTDLSTQGMTYAKMNVSFAAWFELIAVFRDGLRRRVTPIAAADLKRAMTISDGMNRFLDVTMALIGEAYLAAKEEIIRDQQAAIREVSTPVLQIRDDVLVLPIVGVVDTHRARQITESVLTAIRVRRARAVVMDVTGVPLVDSKVAKHLAQTCEAARLMGCLVILTGISQEIAQTLVTIGADLSSIRTLGDLQSGVEEVERLIRVADAQAPTVRA